MLSLNHDKISDTLKVARLYTATLERYDFQGNAVAEDFENFKDAIAEAVASNLTLIDELPPLKNLSATEIKKHIKKKIENQLEKDELFEKTVEIKKYANDIVKYITDY